MTQDKFQCGCVVTRSRDKISINPACPIEGCQVKQTVERERTRLASMKRARERNREARGKDYGEGHQHGAAS